MAELIKITREKCEIDELDGELTCKRQGNWDLRWAAPDGFISGIKVCYRHRARALDLCLVIERAATDQRARELG